MGSAPAPGPPRRRRAAPRIVPRIAPAITPPPPPGKPPPAVGAGPGPVPRRRRSRGRTLVLFGIVLAALWLSRSRWWPTPPPAQMILVLGGDVAREKAAAHLAQHDGLPVLVSGGSNPEYARWLFQDQGVDPSRLQLDYRAIDTLTNFTTLVDELRRAHIRHALLVTSSDHMPRALLVGRLVAGSRGIHLTPVPVPCGSRCIPEGRRRIWGDGLRALIWVVSGRDLRHWAEEHLAPWLEPGAGEGSGPPRASD